MRSRNDTDTESAFATAIRACRNLVVYTVVSRECVCVRLREKESACVFFACFYKGCM